MKNIVLIAVLALSTSVQVYASESNALKLDSIEVIETTNFVEARSLTGEEGEDPKPEEPKKPITFNEGAERVGKVIQIGKDIVALGESVYELVKKGKPTNTTTYAAISVVPKDPTTKEIVSPFDLEGFSVPVQRSFTAKVANMNGKQVVKFDYILVYAHGGSFDGKGKYLTSVMIVPKHVETSWGWEFNATMKLDAIMNHGTKADPVAGALVTLKYQMNGFSKSVERNDTIHVSGNGEVKSFGVQ